MISQNKGKGRMEQMNKEQLIQNFEDIMISMNEYVETVNEKIELIEEMVVDLQADLTNARKLTTYSYRTIEQLRTNFIGKDLTKIQSKLVELSFRPQTIQGNASNPVSEEEKEKQQLKTKLLVAKTSYSRYGHPNY